MYKLDIQMFGGRGARLSASSSGANSDAQFLKSLVSAEMDRGDLEGVIEAQYGFGAEGERMLERYDDMQEEIDHLAKIYNPDRITITEEDNKYVVTDTTRKRDYRFNTQKEAERKKREIEKTNDDWIKKILTTDLEDKSLVRTARQEVYRRMEKRNEGNQF